jgi:hypothetical protein
MNFEIPENAPKVGDVCRHYKGNNYRVVGIALDSSDEWMIVYEPLYENPAAKLFTRPLREWSEDVEWEGVKLKRFTKQ